ncbi:MAG: methionyl-tRNA formyltransferase [Candidatus Liptonbacteria bacterium]|nr:methionyl-tRNA formyltransferase [Candidatus Liptonbacteria bacterium]
MKNLKYIFFGTPEFAAVILEELIKAGFIPSAIICNPDKPVGRKKIITPPLTKILAEKYDIDILQPEILINHKLDIINYKPDFFVVAAYSKILPKEILDIPKLGAIGVHPSLLPKHRGSSPIQAAILNGDEQTGLTLYLMDEKMDHGPILIKQKLEFSINKNNFKFLILSQKLAKLGADLLIKILPDFVLGKITPLPQDESQATYTKKFFIQDAYIEPTDLEKAQGSTNSLQEIQRLAVEIDRKIRALNPEPGIWTHTYKNTKLYEITKTEKRIKILEAILTLDGKLKLKKIQIEGKKPIII